MNIKHYADALRKALKFSDHSTVQQMAAGLTHAHFVGRSHPDWTPNHETDRGAFADAYEEATGDSDGANAARDYRFPLHYDHNNGKAGYGVVRHVMVRSFTGSDAEPIISAYFNGTVPELMSKIVADNRHRPSQGRLYDDGYMTNLAVYGEQPVYHDGHYLDVIPAMNAAGLYRTVTVPVDEGHNNWMYSDGSTTTN